jgi:hypothetical protein
MKDFVSDNDPTKNTEEGDGGSQTIEKSENETLRDENHRVDQNLLKIKVDASETVVNKENLNLGDGVAQSIENSTISEIEILEDETSRFDEKFAKADIAETIDDKENMNLGGGFAQSIENSTISEIESLEDETPQAKFSQKNIQFMHPEKSQKFRCQICNTTLLSEKDLKTHTSSVHEEKKPFKCGMCK